ncbi:MAG: hypothetical protein A2V63_04710 [Candidatus Eisenbacteria bacterium RBG_19FT_COMBO_70_11]|nr:MAG: hypothetical protein A2V63_04710 [Candidatus Eisenbacteria bacterium RBG_19FT_COMBO_70_11]
MERHAPGRAAPTRAFLGLLLTGVLLALGLVAIARSETVADTRLAALDGGAGRRLARATPDRGSAGRAIAVTPPDNLQDLQAWLAYKSRSHVLTLPQESRLFYRRGLLVRESGGLEEASRLARGAAALDPGFVAPHLTLASWYLLRDPSQALLHYAAVIEIARRNFVLQLSLLANLLYAGLQAVLLGLLAAGLLIVFLRVGELHHAWRERLGLLLSLETGNWWAWALLVLPYLAGVGPVLPTIFFLGLLWPLLRAGERAVFVTLVLALALVPWTAGMLDRLASPLRADQGPFYGVSLLEAESYSEERVNQMAALAQQQPDNPFVQFGLAWTARRGNDIATAEAAYRRALELWPGDVRVLNNLGNTVAMQGRHDEALELYQQAIRADGTNAAAYFNASQIYTQRFDYRAANEALSTASSLNFEMVKNYQSEAGADGFMPLVDEWIAPQAFWSILLRGGAEKAARPVLPASWRARIEFSGWWFSVVALLLAAAAVALGTAQHRAMPLRHCTNCGRVVCRRCAERRRELALCPVCSGVEARAESSEFAHVLLQEQRRRAQRLAPLMRAGLATLVPGFGVLVFRRTFAGVILLVCAMALSGGWLGVPAPFAYEPRLASSDAGVPLPLAIAAWVGLYLISIVAYLALRARAELRAAKLAAPTRSRSAQASRSATATAA